MSALRVAAAYPVVKWRRAILAFEHHDIHRRTRSGKATKLHELALISSYQSTWIEIADCQGPETAYES
jgi:hypothetical protein